MKLSILVPGIRIANWEKLYNSVNVKDEWEMIIITPYDLPDNMKDKKNVVHIIDWGTPIRCQQLGLIQAKGEYISWSADDGIYIGSALQNAIDMLEDTEKTVVMSRYREGNGNTDPMMKDEYYHLHHHASCQLAGIPKDCLMLNCGLVPRQLLIEVGGWDCQFEVCPYSYNDLAVRLNLYEVKFIMQDECMFKCSHMPGHEGDHGPIHDAQTIHDEPLFQQLWANEGRKSVILITNWESTPDKWVRRFN